MAQKAGELKKRCWLAKQRLKMGYWESVKREKQQVIENGGDSQIMAAAFAHARFKRDAAEVVGKTAALDEKMYQKVCEILDRDETTINPIGQLIESDIYERLDPAAKQRYILELSNKFRELKDRYYRERASHDA